MSTDSGNKNHNNQIPPRKRITTQAEREEKQKSKKQKEEIQNMNIILKIIMNRTDLGKELWISEQCDMLRNFTRYVNSHPREFQYPITDACRIEDNMPHPSIRSRPALLPNFIKTLEDNSFDATDETRPILQVVSYQAMYEDNGQHNNLKRIRLMLTDGDNEKKILAVVGTNLYHDAKLHLAKGHPIIQLYSYTPTEYSSHGSTERHPGILIQNYLYLCSPSINPLLDKDYPIATCTNKPSRPQHFAHPQQKQNTQQQQPTTKFHKDMLEFNKTAENKKLFEPLPVHEMGFCKAESRLCSKYGVSYCCCLAEKHFEEMKKKDYLEAISEHCYFVTSEIEQMSNKHKRNLLYWWYMTNFYFVKGAGKRKDPPDCLKCAIRMAHPNKHGEPYTGFFSA